jgi:hypothetical protein
MEMPIASVKIQKFADVLEPETDLLCPRCKSKPKWNGGYDCVCCPKCGKPLEAVVVDEKGTVNYKCSEDGWQDPSHYNHWSQLLRVDKATGEPITKTKFTEPDKDVVADAFIMDLKEFSNIADATLNEYGVVVTDETSAQNLRKLLIATKNLGKVVFIRYLDTYEERIAILTTSISNRIILKEIIPLNLADIKETMRIDLSGITEQDIAEAEAFVKQLPIAKESLLNVSDYRVKGVKAKPITPKVMELEQILAKVKA